MSVIDQPKTVREGEDLDIIKVETYLKDTITGLSGELTVRQFPSGFPT